MQTFKGRVVIRLSATNEGIRVKPENLIATWGLPMASESLSAAASAELRAEMLSPCTVRDAIAPAAADKSADVPVVVEEKIVLSPTPPLPAKERIVATTTWDAIWAALIAIATLLGALVGWAEKKHKRA